MAITVKDIHEKDFSKQVRGYSIEEVDDFLDELASQMEIMIKENRDLSAELENVKAAAAAAPVAAPVVTPIVEAAPVQAAPLMDEPQYFKNLETTLRDTLMNAQRLADETIAEARKKANGMVASAEEQAAAIMAGAKAESEKIHAESDDMKKAAADYRAKFLRLLEEQAHILQADETIFTK